MVDFFLLKWVMCRKVYGEKLDCNTMHVVCAGEDACKESVMTCGCVVDFVDMEGVLPYYTGHFNEKKWGLVAV